MWEHDCGALPVVTPRGSVLGMVTDRDICMAAYTQGKSVWEIPVSTACSAHIHSVHPNDLIANAIELMRMHRVRRLAVLDRGRNLVGIVSVADIVRALGVAGHADVEGAAGTLADLMRPSGRCVAAVRASAEVP
jgi:CBS-domain-containing membrane protein